MQAWRESIRNVSKTKVLKSDSRITKVKVMFAIFPIIAHGLGVCKALWRRVEQVRDDPTIISSIIAQSVLYTCVKGPMT